MLTRTARIPPSYGLGWGNEYNMPLGTMWRGINGYYERWICITQWKRFSASLVAGNRSSVWLSSLCEIVGRTGQWLIRTVGRT